MAISDKLATLERGYTIDAEGLVIQDEAHISRTRWREIGLEICNQHNKWLWALGDWINAHRGEWGEMYAMVADITGYSVEYCMGVARVAKAFPRGTRGLAITWSHYNVSMSLPEGKRMPMLQKAAAEGLSHKVIKSEIVDYNASRRPPEAQKKLRDRLDKKDIAITKVYAKCPQCSHVFPPRKHVATKEEIQNALAQHN